MLYLFRWLFVILITLLLNAKYALASADKEGNNPPLSKSLIVLVSKSSDISQLYANQLSKDSGLLVKTINIIENDLADSKLEKYIIVGRNALQEYINKGYKNKAIAIFIKKTTFHHLIESARHQSLAFGSEFNLSNISAIYSDPNPFNQLKLSKVISPIDTKVAVITTEKTHFLIDELNLIADKLDIELTFIEHERKDRINLALNKLSDIDSILAIPDNSVWNTKSLKNILLTTYRKDISIIGFSRTMVKAGSVVTSYSDINDIVSETMLILMTMQLSPIRKYPKQFNFDYNEKVSRSLGKYQKLKVYIKRVNS